MIPSDSLDKRAILLTGEWTPLAPLARALASQDDIELVEGAQGRPAVVVHAMHDVEALSSELAEIRAATSAPVILLTTEPSAKLLEQAAALRDADVVLVDAARPAQSCGSVAFAVHKALLAARNHDKARVFTVFSPKGGTGKSVTSTNLATVFAQQGRRALLVDLDVQFGDVAIMLGLEPERTLHDAVESPGALDERKLAGFVLQHSSGLDVLAAPEHPEQAESLTEDKIGQLLDVACAVYDVVVVDTSPYFHGPMLTALDRTDELLLLSGPDIPTLKNLRLVLRTLAQISFPLARTRLVLNRAGERAGLEAPDLTTALDLPVSFELPYDSAVPQSVNRGMPAVMNDGDSPFACALTEMAAQLFEGRDAARPAAARIRRPLAALLAQRRKAAA